MSAALREAMDYYRAGNHVMVMRKLGPLIENRKTVDPAMALMMAQSCMRLNQLAKAAHWYERACAPGVPNIRQLQMLAATLHAQLGNWQRSLDIAEDLLRQNAHDLAALNTQRLALRMLLRFHDIEDSDRKVRALMEADFPGIFDMEKPLDHIFWSDEDRFAARLTRIDGGKTIDPAARLARRNRPHVFGEPIRVGYISNDLCDRHATMVLVRSVLSGHDAGRVQPHVFCYTNAALRAADGGGRNSLPNLHDIGTLSDEAAIALIRECGIDILVDLKGHTRDARPGILNGGAAPIQVAWLGFPGLNTGIDCDYMIGDSIVTPEDKQSLWPASFCRLPETYQPNDAFCRPLPPPVERSALGLPADRVVLASFNGQRKISPRTFRLWSEILRSVPETVLWIAIEGEEPRRNFSEALAAGGIDPSRLIFADILPYADHIARLQAADMALDTFPCNGHTTTSDKLWAGLPLVTMRGRNFASRVSESLLRALDLPELVVEDEAGYLALNVRLAADASFRVEIRQKIEAHRFAAALFDTERFTRHLEDAYGLMVDRARAGLPPAPIDVPARAKRTTPFRP